MLSTKSLTILREVKNHPEKTVVVLGCPRGGTSMVAGVLRELEIPMGEKINPGNHEDTDFLTKDIAHIKTTIKQRNEKYSVWGWKVPDTIHYLDQIVDDLHNPCYIVIYRNLLSVANSIHRYHNEIGVTDALLLAESYYKKINEFVSNTQAPVLLINFEEVIQDKENVVDHIVQFLNLGSDTERTSTASSFINDDRGYQQVKIKENTKFSVRKLDKPATFQYQERKFILTSENLVCSGPWQNGIHSDPQFNLFFLEDNDTLPSEMLVTMHVDWKGDKPHSRIYLDTGLGYSEVMQATMDINKGQNYFLIKSGKPLCQLRIDPADNDYDVFLFKDFEIWE